MNILDFLMRHWFKFIIVGILVVIFFKKEVSLGIDLNTPKQQIVEEAPTETELKTTEEKVEKADEVENPPQLEQMSLKDQLASLPFWRTGKTYNSDVFSEVEIEVLDDYINRFARLARGEKEQHNIPAAIILASGLLQSNVGQSELTKSAHNHFQLKCTEDWKGELQWHQGQCYRVYDRAWTSFRDYSLFLTTGKNANLLDLAKDDYQAWAEAIEASDFFEQDNLAEKLIDIIEKYNLKQLDV